VSSLLTAELAAKLKIEGKTLYQRLDELFLQYGCYTESQISLQMPGEKGMDDMRALMSKLRTAPPVSLGGLKIAALRDYLNNTCKKVSGTISPLGIPPGDMVILDFETEGNYIAIRPSGTEPKVKIYLFAYDSPEAIADLEATKATQIVRLKAIGADIRTFSGT
jgi:phosphomannomutase